MAHAYLCVGIDTECDKGAGWRCERPLAYAGILEGVAGRLQPLFRQHRAKATYLLSPEVMRDEASVEALRRLDGDHELGTHLHGEFAEPGRYEPDVTAVFQRDYAPDVERQKLVDTTDLFIRAFGHQPRSFRAGRFGIGPNTVGILESLGYVVESSVTPFMDWSSSGAPGLAFPNAPTQPYRPDPASPGDVGDADLLEVPVTIRRRWVNALPVVGAHVDPAWLRPTRSRASTLVRIAQAEIAEARARDPERPVILNAMLHNVEIVAGKSPYAATEDAACRILDNLGGLLAFARREGIPVIGLGDVPEVLAA